uniref:Ribonuclease-like storage protein n=1 Tax=Crassostrea virginica TaxID=6565 RepID=A0A8B8AHN9_CRAVI|nr:ribonuclease-like storage protein [Crassostrea virginica]
MQWPASFCSTLSTKDTCIESPPNQWTIHGLWPKNLYCHNSFNIGEISESARVQLAKLWPNLNASSNNEQFLEREWKKHGSCSNLTIEQYFKKVIQLASLYNIYNILEKNSIKPSKIHYTPFLVSEIRFCFDQAFRMMDCNTTYQLNPLLYLEHWNKHDEHKESGKAGGSVFVILLIGVVIPVTMICLTIVYFKVFYKHERTSSSDGIYMQVK